MNKTCHNTNPIKRFRFKNWSRRSFAAFNSLHIQVSIGRLATHISDRIGKKITTLQRVISQFNRRDLNADEEQEAFFDQRAISSHFQLLISILFLSISSLNSSTAGSGRKNLFHYTLHPSPYLALIFSPFPAFYLVQTFHKSDFHSDHFQQLISQKLLLT